MLFIKKRMMKISRTLKYCVVKKRRSNVTTDPKEKITITFLNPYLSPTYPEYICINPPNMALRAKITPIIR